jgi:hypothetical protein
MHAREVAPAGDLAELVGIERVDRHVDAADAVPVEIGGVFGQLRAVGGQRQFFERAGLEVAAKLFDQMHDVLAHQRLAAGQPQFLHALLDEHRAQPVQFLERQKVLLRQEGHVFRHAIGAAKIAAVGHRHAQIGDVSAEGIGHDLPCRQGDIVSHVIAR